jgi:hypothetical protein
MDQQPLSISWAAYEQDRLNDTVNEHRAELLAVPHVIWVGPGMATLKWGEKHGVNSGLAIAVEVDMPDNVSTVERVLPNKIDGYAVVVNQPIALEWRPSASGESPNQSGALRGR